MFVSKTTSGKIGEAMIYLGVTTVSAVVTIVILIAIFG